MVIPNLAVIKIHLREHIFFKPFGIIRCSDGEFLNRNARKCTRLDARTYDTPQNIYLARIARNNGVVVAILVERTEGLAVLECILRYLQ